MIGLKVKSPLRVAILETPLGYSFFGLYAGWMPGVEWPQNRKDA